MYTEIINLQRDSIALQMEWLYLLGKRKFHIMFTPITEVNIRCGRTSLLEKWHDNVHYSRNMNQILVALNQCLFGITKGLYIPGALTKM